MTTPATLHQERVEEFVGTVLNDTSATMVTLLAVLGDHLGLFRDLAASGPSTSAELAQRTGIQARYAREWLGGMAACGYLDYDPALERFSLPPEHAPALAQEGGPFFFGGFYHMLPSLVRVLDELTGTFRKGGGVPQSSYDRNLWDGMERFTNSWFNNHLLQEWIPAMSAVQAKLESGAKMADIGCGRGRALILLAKAFPKSTFVGYDVWPPQLETAADKAKAEGVGDRVRFEQLDVVEGLPEKYDIISTFDVVHDSVDPLGLLRSIRAALKEEGSYIRLDVNCSDRLEENKGPLGAMFHGFSVFYCMTTSLSRNGAGLGTLGFHEPKVRELCREAGLREVRYVPVENPFNKLYEIRP